LTDADTKKGKERKGRKAYYYHFQVGHRMDSLAL